MVGQDPHLLPKVVYSDDNIGALGAASKASVIVQSWRNHVNSLVAPETLLDFSSGWRPICTTDLPAELGSWMVKSVSNNRRALLA